MPAEATFALLAATPLELALAEAEADDACWPPCVGEPPPPWCGRPPAAVPLAPPLLPATVDTSAPPRIMVVDLPTLTVKEVTLFETLRGMVA